MTNTDVHLPPHSASTTTLSPISSLSTLNTTTASITDKPLPQIPSPVSSPTSASHKWLASLRRPRSTPKGAGDKQNLQKRALLGNKLTDPETDARRDSGLITASPVPPSTPPAHSNGDESNLAPAETHPSHDIHNLDPVDDIFATSDVKRSVVAATPRAEVPNEHLLAVQEPSEEFKGLTTQIPTSSLEVLSSADRLDFSARGSMLLDGKRLAAFANGFSPKKGRKREKSLPTLSEIPQRSEPASSIPIRITNQNLSADETNMSYKVRAMYENGSDNPADWAENQKLIEEEREDDLTSLRAGSPGIVTNRQTSSRLSTRSSVIERQPHELAGGIEDWENVGEGEVDRYGFIVPKNIQSGSANAINSLYDSPSGVQRVSTALQEVSSSPRPKNSLRRRLSKAKSERSAATHTPSLGFLGRAATQSNGSIAASQNTHFSSLSVAASPLRRATNRLPHNRQRRLLDEASDMLTLPPGLADLAEEQDNGQAAMSMKRKEWQREDKWRKMGRPSQPTPVSETPAAERSRKRSSTVGSTKLKGGGMLFEFDPHDPKVTSRIWKGIPDRWRASAWYSFLSQSYRHHNIGRPDDELTRFFTEAQDAACSDDVQIDCDVPRTINRHIMFRRRYRGGQRLLFRVLHAIALYAPDVGYVQGMAAIAATLLSYFDEEKAFICMVRLWELRGLKKLFANGFGGLMGALDEFEKQWLGAGDVGKSLTELGISPTAYGTRWYLTLFNYSIPFPAQLRVWDVFMLLGDAAHPLNNTRHQLPSHPSNQPATTQSNVLPGASALPSSSSSPSTFSFYPADLSPLHATSAALIDATREILLGSDFENTMKVLTSWVPIKDEDMLMRVVAAEWKAHAGKPAE